MRHDIDPGLSWEELMRQSSSTAHDFMRRAIDSIDTLMGEGYAAKHPELIGAFIQASAMDFHTTSMGIAFQKLNHHLYSALMMLGQKFERDEKFRRGS